MNITIKIALVVIIGLALTMGTGCATSKVWISSPAAQTAGNPYYEAKIEPLKSVNKFFVSFRLVVAPIEPIKIWKLTGTRRVTFIMAALMEFLYLMALGLRISKT